MRGGPIPARTGQPIARKSRSPAGWAYPRSHGATHSIAATRACAGGLSPLARGNPPPFTVDDAWGGLSPLARGNRGKTCSVVMVIGPIPARTGQPWLTRHSSRGRRAYPRSHGATFKDRIYRSGLTGLSPLARGNLIRSHPSRNKPGPIPARTGQPPEDGLRQALDRAYPRSHGATSST